VTATTPPQTGVPAIGPAIGRGIMLAAYSEMPVERHRDGKQALLRDCIAEEMPVALVYNGMPYAVMLTTPAQLEEFALGFSLSEGIIAAPAELRRMSVRPRAEGVEMRLTIPAERYRGIAGTERRMAGRSGCGLCGVRVLEQAVKHPPAVTAGVRIGEEALCRTLAELSGWQALNSLTGAVHAAAWATAAGEIVMLREDVGRHNALDKLIGAIATTGLDFSAGYLIVTSRASYEMVQKAAMVGITLMAAVSAPTALAIRLAEETRLTLIGFARGADHVIYSHAGRLLKQGEPA
jgi:FdhD protein